MILSKEDMKRWLSKICRSDPDFEIEATLISSHEVTLRYAMNRIHQNLDEAQTNCSIPRHERQADWGSLSQPD